ncbi:hypothetical protein WG66_006843 [Moniliophthora roreri]|nr:hypothetical protein WG66_006843 [Moniliophthora roreri]
MHIVVHVLSNSRPWLCNVSWFRFFFSSSDPLPSSLMKEEDACYFFFTPISLSLSLSSTAVAVYDKGRGTEGSQGLIVRVQVFNV